MKNEEDIIRMYETVQRKEKKNEEFYYLGNSYDVVVLNTISKIKFVGNQVFVKNKTYLNTFLKNECERIFNERLEIDPSRVAFACHVFRSFTTVKKNFLLSVDTVFTKCLVCLIVKILECRSLL